MNLIALVLVIGILPSLVCTLFLIGHRVRPHPSWTPRLTKARLFVLVLAGTALLYLSTRHLLIDARDAGARLETYMAAVTFAPCILSGLVALFFKP
ncbi:hypothetical protein CLU95_2748 [Variovorax sp. 54]|uniref:hypothetical protein n=1 Tax=Variovorax sp. 54 TaxID=2035212 RepID=UPI000C19E74F|nr:hypothetical protein [Variovorax sp. 54]PIF75598.1 hypothetical protein CLU95_2748 [Variovorax sp. 54]